MHRQYPAARPSSARAAVVAALACCALGGLAPHGAGAQIAPGSTLTFTGTADATDLGSPGVVLAFRGPVRADPSANTGTFASLNKRNGPGVSGPIQDVLVGNGPQRINNFVVLGGYRFDLASLPSGPYGQDDCYVAPAAGQRCTPFQSPGFELSPFFLTNLPSGDPDAPFTAVVAFNVVGSVTGPGNATSDFFGTITSTFAGASFQEALFALEQGGLAGIPFTGTFVAGPVGGTRLAGGVTVAALVPEVVPEPATVALVAVGLGVVGAGARRRGARLT